jgi:ATP-dependent protease ClpP protease subunit
MPKPWYSIKAAAEASETAEVSILEPISSWYGCSAQSFLTEFRALKANKVKVYINSPGGHVVEALAIFNGMRATGKNIEVHVLGVAASAASYIAMAGDKIVMPANTMMFLHNPINAVYGNADEMRAQAEVLDKFASVLTNTYMKRWTGTEDELKDVLKAESWLTAAECLKHGLCDEVTEEITATALFDVEMLPEAARALFKREAPAAVVTPPAATTPPAASPLAADEIEAIAKAAGIEAYAAAMATDDKLTTTAQAQARAGEIKQIVALCRVTKFEDRAASLISAHTSYADARKAINSARVEADAHINTAAAASSLQGGKTVHAPLDTASIWAEYNAAKAGSK